MDDNNSFLGSYKKNMEVRNINSGIETEVKTTPLPRYEENSGFVKPKKKEMAPLPPSGGGRPKYLVPLIAGAAVILVAVLLLLLLGGQGVEATDFTGAAESSVQLWAKENSVLLQAKKEYNDKYEEGKVVSQSRKKGERIKKGEIFEITVSQGHDLTVTLPLPDIMSMTKDQIEKWAADNFMAKVRITGEFNDSVPLGKVIKFETNDASVVDKVSRNTPIYVIVSKGVQDEAAMAVAIPNFKEKSLAECYTFANENGLVLKVEEQYDEFMAKGTIISQSIKKDEKVKKGTEVKITVSKGKMITIPDFSGYTKEKASALAGQLQIPVTVTEKYSGSATGKLISQSLPEGSTLEEGTMLELTYSLGNKIALASYVNQTKDVMENWAKELNDKGAKITIKVTTSQSNAAKGTIIYQDVANTMIPIKATINITVSLGKAVFMPDFAMRPSATGYGYDAAITRDQALATCEELKIIPIFKEEACAGKLPGEVWYQDIGAGTEITEGTKITLKYVPYTKVTVPDFVNELTWDTAKQYGKNLLITFVAADQYDPKAEGKIVWQSLLAKTTVKSGSAITLKINTQSLTPEPATPDTK